MVPSIAIIDQNTLEASGLKSIICDIVPGAVVSIFTDFADLEQAVAAGEPFVHFFASSQAVVEHSEFFLAHVRQTIVLTSQNSVGRLLAPFHCLSTNMKEHDLIKAVLHMHQYAHGQNGSSAGHPGHMHAPDIIGPSIDISAREQEVLALVARGFLNKEIADALCISLPTVISHRKNICDKLHLRSVSSLTIYAVTHGIVRIEDI
ncbi:MAG: helix-turn-helix transcriptional regulator [Bacteroidaceae bacterium]|nr:helix-turn-helix transcriptional regulator [Bacteroidaceae bacterium]MBR1801081.1 helix-turn-helix transcriptional regulator [Bacteroidaceae bacterium]